MGIIIQKFGGTSFRNLNNDSYILKHIKECIDSDNYPLIVVSAIGRKGEPYATDTLIEQLEKIDSKIDPKIKDLIMSCGETISAAIISQLLNANKIQSVPLTGFQAGILTDKNFNSAEIINIDISNIIKNMNEGKVAVVAGFQGITEDNEITTLGRGGSDITAIALGGYLNAERVDIFTDVPGVAIIDPKLVPNTKYIEKISYDNMYKLASNGVKVIHPNSIKIAKEFNIPVRITSTYSNVQGTIISNKNNDRNMLLIAVDQKEGNTIFTVFFNSESEDFILKNLNRFLKDKKKDILDVLSRDEKISIYTDTKDLSLFAQNLYKYLTVNNRELK